MRMAPAHVFAYGSLTEDGSGRPYRLRGWRRRWGVAMDNRQTIPGYKYFLDAAGGRPAVHVAFLDLVPDPGAAVDGVVFEAGDLGALDARERNYRRVELRAGAGPVWAYVGLAEARERYETGPTVISRAYLETVRAGFAAFGMGFGPEPELPVMDLTRVEVPPA
jgi:cation transport regulator ChaC